MRDTSYAANTATAAWLPGAADSVTLLGALPPVASVHLAADEPVTVQEDGGAAPAAEETPVPADPHAGTAEITPSRPRRRRLPPRSPDAAPAETQTPAPTAAPTADPYGSPDSGSDASARPVPDPTAAGR